MIYLAVIRQHVILGQTSLFIFAKVAVEVKNRFGDLCECTVKWLTVH